MTGPAGTVSLRVIGVGRGHHLSRLDGTRPREVSGAVVYAFGALSAWYRPKIDGLEQGFTLARPPEGSRAHWLTVAVRTSALDLTLHGHLVVLANRPGGAGGFAYGDLVARDASGRILPVRLESRGDMLFLKVADAGAAYPVTIDPLIQQGAKLNPAGGELATEGALGTSVALSGAPTSAISPLYESGGVWTNRAQPSPAAMARPTCSRSASAAVVHS